MKFRLKLWEITLFPLLGAFMSVSKIMLEFLPNIHMLAMLTMVYTVVFRKKALIPIYIFVLIHGVIAGFNLWWIPYVYLWTVLWGVTMLLPQKVPTKFKVIMYAVVCSLHGFLYGTLYAPMQALMFGLNFKQTIAWIIAGLPFDAVHGIGNLFMGLLIVPLSSVLSKTIKRFN